MHPPASCSAQDFGPSQTQPHPPPPAPPTGRCMLPGQSLCPPGLHCRLEADPFCCCCCYCCCSLPVPHSLLAHSHSLPLCCLPLRPRAHCCHHHQQQQHHCHLPASSPLLRLVLPHSGERVESLELQGGYESCLLRVISMNQLPHSRQLGCPCMPTVSPGGQRPAHGG